MAARGAGWLQAPYALRAYKWHVFPMPLISEWRESVTYSDFDLLCLPDRIPDVWRFKTAERIEN